MRIPWDGGKWVTMPPHPNDTTAQRLDEKGGQPNLPHRQHGAQTVNHGYQ